MKLDDQLRDAVIQFAADQFPGEAIILHRPVFSGNEKVYLSECIDSNFV